MIKIITNREGGTSMSNGKKVVMKALLLCDGDAEATLRLLGQAGVDLREIRRSCGCDLGEVPQLLPQRAPSDLLRRAGPVEEKD